MRKLLLITSAAMLALALGAGSAAARVGPPQVGFYANDALYRTVATPTDLSNTGAPDHSFDAIYALGNNLMNVAEAAPGDTDYNGGRWMVVPVIWHITPVQFTNDDQVLAAEAAGDIEFGDPIAYFVCPAIPVPGNGG